MKQVNHGLMWPALVGLFLLLAPASPGSTALADETETKPVVPSDPLRIVIETPPPPPFSLAILGEQKPVEASKSPAEQQRIVIETPPPPPFSLAILEAKPAAASVAPEMPALPLSADKARAILLPHWQRLKLRPALIDQLIGAYAARNWQPVWFVGPSTLAPRAAGVLASIQQADEDGLDPKRPLSLLPNAFEQLVGTASLEDDARVEADLLLSAAAYVYAHDARGGRLEPARLSSLLTPELTLPTPAEVIGKMLRSANSAESREALLAFNPHHAGYRALRTELARLRREQSAASDFTASSNTANVELRAKLPEGFMGQGGLVPGQRDPRVAFMRERLGLPATGDEVYDDALADAVREFQRANGLKPDGRVTPRTRALLEVLFSPVTRAEKQKSGADDRVPTVLANMERWRWLPPELGRTHIFVNIPDYRMHMVDEGERVFETRVIVGKPETQTPVFSDKMEFLVVNPSWYVPPSILKKEFLPKLATDPDYATRRGYEVIRRGNAVSVRQPPGERNALGNIKFMFPNSHAVYLHDTPGRHLFRSETRAFSHGCVRVEGPFRLAEALLQRRQGLSERNLRAMLGPSERHIKLSETVPVHLAYFTAFVDENGMLMRKPDIYGHDSRIRRALAF
ncbi:YkuD_like domain containing protein [Rhabdaerophilaceae bacterium]